jgi:hypothetical protein
MSDAPSETTEPRPGGITEPGIAAVGALPIPVASPVVAHRSDLPKFADDGFVQLALVVPVADGNHELAVRVSLPMHLCQVQVRPRRHDAREPASSDAPAGDGGDGRMTTEAKAMVALYDHQEWTMTQIAKAAGCTRSHLYRLPKFMAARTLMKSSGLDRLPKGTLRDGRIEAFDESGGDEDDRDDA